MIDIVLGILAAYAWIAGCLAGFGLIWYIILITDDATAAERRSAARFIFNGLFWLFWIAAHVATFIRVLWNDAYGKDE